MKKTIVFLLTALLILLTTILTHSVEIKELNELLNSIEVGNPIYSNNLTVIPIYKNNKSKESNFIFIDEALRKNYLIITELDGGNVPQVKITNKSDKTIFFMGGEIITGSKQDRIIARDVIIGPKRKSLIVPVFCVEQGRWNYNSNTFYSKENLGTSKLRAEAQKSKGESQSNIWNEISKYVKKNKVESNSQAYQDIYEDKKVKEKIISIEKDLKKVENLKEGTIGAIVAIGDKVISLDIFAYPYMFKKFWPKILKSSAFSSLNDETKKNISLNNAIKFIHNLKLTDSIKIDAIDLGKEYSMMSKDINANFIIFNNNVIHIAAFPEDKLSYNNIDKQNQIFGSSSDLYRRQ